MPITSKAHTLEKECEILELENDSDGNVVTVRYGGYHKSKFALDVYTKNGETDEERGVYRYYRRSGLVGRGIGISTFNGNYILNILDLNPNYLTVETETPTRLFKHSKKQAPKGKIAPRRRKRKILKSARSTLIERKRVREAVRTVNERKSNIKAN